MVGHYLFAVRLTWRGELLYLLVFPESEPCAEWPVNIAGELVARQLIAQLGAVLG